ncbi:carbohydrate-binding module family 50 protein, partial [Tulasnella calospora MUT 4182]
AALAVAQTDSNSNACVRSYEVQSGDTCDVISAANNVSTYQLYTLNTDINDSCSNLWVGQTLCLGLSEGDCQTTYVVESGDSCWLIATNHGIDIETLLSNNLQVNSDCSNICEYVRGEWADLSLTGGNWFNRPRRSPLRLV